jgi:hypothetical protein
MLDELEAVVQAGRLSPTAAAQRVLRAFLRSPSP